MKTKIAIVGIGNIGKRHLQAVSRLPGLGCVTCFDLNRETLDGVRPFCTENQLNFNELAVTGDYRRLLDSLDAGTIVIVAATAQGRQPLLDDILGRRPLAVIAEKPLCQNRREYENILAAAEKNGVPLYVNLNRHLFSFYRQIKEELKGKKVIGFSAAFPDGMACIGIHMLELATWLTGASEYRLLQAGLDKKYETKRKGFYDFTGRMSLLLDGEITAVLEALEHDGLFAIRLATADREYTIYEFAKKVIVADNGNQIRTIDIEVPYISQTTGQAVKDIVAGSGPQLPTAREAFLAHQMLYDYLSATGLEGVNIT